MPHNKSNAADRRKPWVLSLRLLAAADLSRYVAQLMYMGLEILWYIVYSLIGLIIYAFIQALVTTPGRILQEKFRCLGTLTGKRKAEIIDAVGTPNSVSGLPDGKILLQWMATGYHIALVFNGDICEGVSHESANF